MNSYSSVLEWLAEHPDDTEDGPIVEFGAWIGANTAVLARAYPKRKIYAVDIFAPETDLSTNDSGSTMAELYLGELGGRDQRSLFDENTKLYKNVQVLAMDSKAARFDETHFYFSIIDGNHADDYVRSDFFKTWPYTRYYIFHDYGHDLPRVTRQVDLIAELLQMEKQKIEGGYCALWDPEYRSR